MPLAINATATRIVTDHANRASAGQVT